jgi:hypothetical protein
VHLRLEGERILEISGVDLCQWLLHSKIENIWLIQSNDIFEGDWDNMIGKLLALVTTLMGSDEGLGRCRNVSGSFWHFADMVSFPCRF